jgi:hypothetical protein
MHFPLPFFAVPNYFWNFWNNFFELKASKRHASELNKSDILSNSPAPCTPSRACRRARASWSWTRSCSCALSTCAWNQNRTLVQWLSARNLSLNFFKSVYIYIPITKEIFVPEQVCLWWSWKYFGQKNLLKSLLIATLGKVFYYIGTFLQGSAKPLFATQNRL